MPAQSVGTDRTASDQLERPEAPSHSTLQTLPHGHTKGSPLTKGSPIQTFFTLDVGAGVGDGQVAGAGQLRREGPRQLVAVLAARLPGHLDRLQQFIQAQCTSAPRGTSASGCTCRLALLHVRGNIQRMAVFLHAAVAQDNVAYLAAGDLGPEARDAGCLRRRRHRVAKAVGGAHHKHRAPAAAGRLQPVAHGRAGAGVHICCCHLQPCSGTKADACRRAQSVRVCEHSKWRVISGSGGRWHSRSLTANIPHRPA